jgi:hypothetical protein
LHGRFAREPTDFRRSVRIDALKRPFYGPSEAPLRKNLRKMAIFCNFALYIDLRHGL